VFTKPPGVIVSEGVFFFEPPRREEIIASEDIFFEKLGRRDRRSKIEDRRSKIEDEWDEVKNRKMRMRVMREGRVRCNVRERENKKERSKRGETTNKQQLKERLALTH